MAVVPKVLAKRERIGLLQRSKAVNHWAAAADSTVSSAFKEIHWLDVGQVTPDDGVTAEDLNVTSQNGIHKESERRFVDTYGGLIRVPFSGIADKSTLAIFLAAALHVCSEAAGTPFKKVFTAIGLTSVPNFAQNEGYLFDMAIVNNASADDGILLKRGIIDSLSINVNFRGKGQARLFKISGTFLFNSIAYRQTFVTGNWTNTTAAQNFFNNTDAWVMLDADYNEMEIGGVSFSGEYLHDFVLNINNNVEGDNFGTSGVAGQYTIKPAYTGTINFWHNSVTEALIDHIQQNDTIKVFISNDALNAYTDGKFSIYSATGKGLPGGGKKYEGDYIKEQVNFELLSTAAATPLTVTFTDTVDYGF